MKKINSNEKVEGYLVGLITGDGYIEKNTNRVVIATKNRDYRDSIYDLFKKLDFKPTHFFDKKGGEIWKISLHSEKFKNLLINKYGLFSGKKTFIMKKPLVSKIQMKSFIAGLYDAEGWFEINKGKYYRIRLKMMNKNIMSFVEKRLTQMEFPVTSHKKADNSYVVDLNKQPEVKRFFKTIPLLHPKWAIGL